MTDAIRCLAVLSAVCFPLLAEAQPCPGQGTATLAVISDPPAPGKHVEFEVTGAPFNAVIVIADVGPGPAFRPKVGWICLDLGPRRRILVDGFRTGTPTLNADGRVTFGFRIPPRERLGGRTYFLQAFVADPAAPLGIAVSPRFDLRVDRAAVEDFSTVARQDPAATTATWPGNGEASGVASGTRRTVIASRPDTGFLLADPLIPAGSRAQFLIGGGFFAATPGESIVGVEWGPRSNFVFASTYSGVELLLGHAREAAGGLSLVFADSYDGLPTSVFSGDYTVPNRTGAPYFPWPSFTRDFEYDQNRDLVFEVRVPPGAATYQLFRNAWFAPLPRNRVIGSYGSITARAGEATIYDTRFTLAQASTYAQSLYFDTGIDDPDFLKPGIEFLAQPPGTSVTLEVDGAEDADRDGIPDPGSATGFREDIDAIDGRRLVRFRLRLRSNPIDMTVPRVGSVSIPFR